jgi:transposase
LADKGNSKNFKRYLRKVLFEYRNASKIIMVLDNVAFHHAHKIRDWVATHPKLDLFFLPPYSPDLNAVERAWWYMRKKITHHRFIKSLKERKAAFWKMFS